MSGRVASYVLLLPPGWARLPVREGSERAVSELFDRIFADIPRDKATPFRRELQRRVEVQIDAAREIDGLDVYLPIDALRGRPAAASFVVSHVPMRRAGDAAPLGDQAETAVLAELVNAAPAATRTIDIAGSTAVRTERVVGADERAPTSVGEVALARRTRRVDYAVSVPESGGWLILSFSTPELLDQDAHTPPGKSGPRFDDLLVELFDAIVTTLRWRRA